MKPLKSVTRICDKGTYVINLKKNFGTQSFFTHTLFEMLEKHIENINAVKMVKIKQISTQSTQHG